MFQIFIGDVDNYLSVAAHKYSPDALLLDSSNLETYLENPTGVVYTSLADIGSINSLLDICLLADQIFYRPPRHWSDTKNNYSEQQAWTESILCYISQFRQVDQFDPGVLKHSSLSGSTVIDTRQTAGRQIWAVGCSITEGIGVNVEQSWKSIVSQRLGLEYSSLCLNRTSIIWQSDQICQSDIKKDDIVFWGLTSHNRLPVVDKQHNLMHLTVDTFKKNASIIEEFPLEILDNNTLIYHNVMAIRRARNFCTKMGAQIVILGLLPDFDSVYSSYQIPEFRQLAIWPRPFKDLGTDNSHPGPRQHIQYADDFLQFYQDLYSCK